MPFEKCNDINVYYEIHGSGPPLLFLNGLASDISQKMPFINAAKKYFKIIVPDLRGAGRTDKPREPYSIAKMANDVYELIRKLTLNKICVAGFSMGGCVAMNFAILYPELVEGLVLISTTPAYARPCAISEDARRILFSTDISEKLLTDLFNLAYGPNYKKRVSAKSYVETRFADPNPQPLHGYLNQLHAFEEFDLYEKIKNIRAQTLIVTGREDKLISPQNSHWMHENISNSKLIAYDGVGHMPVDECPENLAENIFKFVNSLDSAS